MSSCPLSTTNSTCSICLEYFRDPVSIPCGHSFCRSCIAQCWKERSSDFSCPQCRVVSLQRNFRPNRELGNVVEIAKRLGSRAEQEEPGGGGGGRQLCPKHREALKLFCSEEEELICCICRESRAHRSHAVFPVEEAAHDYKVKSGKTRTHLTGNQAEGPSQWWRPPCGTPSHQMSKRYLTFRRHLKAHQKEHGGKFSDEIVSLSALIDEIEEKCTQPDSEFLQRDIKSKSKSNLELADKNINCSFIPHILSLSLSLFAVNITLDTDTANPQIIISEDRKSARWDVTRTDVPHNPKRFKSSCCVLGCEGFTSGRHYWEVNVEDGGIWAVGVARASVRRKIELKLTPEEGIWALQGDFGQYQALTTPVTPLSPLCTPRRIRVFLDYEREQVEFLNADTKDSVFIFLSASFSGERVFPFFKVLLAQLTLDG
uniref:Zinc finger protein RFP-like n=1 Tax=Podarcis muralis TaxID=64176 RepID=A0A670KDX5_PODMU